jgi:hypothetical protein
MEKFSFPYVATVPRRPGPSDYRGFTITLVTPLDEWSGRHIDLHLATHNNRKRQTFMPSAGFEHVIPASERPHTHVIDRVSWDRQMGTLTTLFVDYRTVELNIKAEGSCAGEVVLMVVVIPQESRSMELGRGVHVSNVISMSQCDTLVHKLNLLIWKAYFFPNQMKSEASLINYTSFASQSIVTELNVRVLTSALSVGFEHTVKR